MFKHTVTYKDYNNVQHTEDLYFHMMVPELVDLEFNPTFDNGQTDGSAMSDFIQEAMQNGDRRKIYTLFKLLIVNSYGRRSEDGALFTKNERWTEAFLNHPSYEAFFVWLVSNPQNGVQFWNSIMPEQLNEIVAQMETEQAKAGEKKKDLKDLTREELQALYLQKVGSSAENVTTSSLL